MPNVATGANLDAPISLLEEEDNDKKRPLEDSSTAPVHRKRPLGERPTSLDTPKSPTNTTVDDRVYGCMRNPTNPIKIFATNCDQAVRKKLKPAGQNAHVDIDSKTIEESYESHWSVEHCWTFREMLGFDRFSELRRELSPEQLSLATNAKKQEKECNGEVGIDWIFITTYILDVDFLLQEVPELLRIPSVVIIYQYKDEDYRLDEWIKEVSSKKNHNLSLLQRSPRDDPRSETNPLKVQMSYGCHHTKMSLVGYSSGRLRVHIHTSNLRYEDVHHKCQGAFVQDFFPKTEDQLSNFVTSEFEESMITYLESYHFLQSCKWNRSSQHHCVDDEGAMTLVSHLQTYDFSTAVGILIPSIPGYHKASIPSNITTGEEVFGYLKVQKAIREHCKNSANGEAGPIVCQFSSMGSLSEAYLDKIVSSWNVDSKANRSSTKESKKGEMTASFLRIVWPTINEIVNSVEGPTGGGSVPGRSKNLHKAFLRPLLHKWKTCGKVNGEYGGDYGLLEKGKHIPHIKTYYQTVVQDSSNIEENMNWFVLSSHNLSKAAWGEIQDRMDPSRGYRREVLTIQHWELGVFLAPSTLRVDTMGPSQKLSKFDQRPNRTTIPLPYEFRPQRYQNSDQPWVVE